VGVEREEQLIGGDCVEDGRAILNWMESKMNPGSRLQESVKKDTKNP
jgi:hypothetical protein